MQQLISNNNGYKVYAEVDKSGTNDNKTYLKFSSEYDNTSSNQQHQKFIMFLTEDERKILKDLL